jgi:hypothetical protein
MLHVQLVLVLMLGHLQLVLWLERLLEQLLLITEQRGS